MKSDHSQLLRHIMHYLSPISAVPLETRTTSGQMLGLVYAKRQGQRCDNSVMTLVILFSLKTMESLQVRVATHFRAILLFSMRTVSLASTQSCRSFDADSWCTRALKSSLGSDENGG